MGYKIAELEPEKAYASVRDYEYALIYMISQVKLCKTEELKETDWEECLEARFFSKDKELHIFEDEGEKKAVEVNDDGQDDIIEKKFQLDNKFKEVGNCVLVQEYLAYDNDGQVRVELTRLKGIV